MDLDAGPKVTAHEVDYTQLKELCKSYPARYALAAFTLDAGDNPDDMALAMSTFKRIALSSLRGHDMLAMYSPNQYVVALPNHSCHSCNFVRDRLCSMFAEAVPGVRIVVETTFI